MKITIHGIWKMDAGKSFAEPGPVVRSELRIYSANGNDGLKLSVEGIDASGAAYSYGAAGKVDGTACPLVGTGTRNGADSTAWTCIDSHTFESKVFKAGKVVNVTRIEVSGDGKVLTLNECGTSPGGAPSRGMRTYDRQ